MGPIANRGLIASPETKWAGPAMKKEKHTFYGFTPCKTFEMFCLILQYPNHTEPSWTVRAGKSEFPNWLQSDGRLETCVAMLFFQSISVLAVYICDHFSAWLSCQYVCIKVLARMTNRISACGDRIWPKHRLIHSLASCQAQLIFVYVPTFWHRLKLQCEMVIQLLRRLAGQNQSSTE